MPKNLWSLSRRTFLMKAAAGSTLLWWPGCAQRTPSSESSLTDWAPSDPSPVDRTSARVLGDTAPREFSGDGDPERFHQILWDKQAFLLRNALRLPREPQTVPLVIVGGGMAGLTTAYLLRDLKPILLEQHPRFGGNSRAESWAGIDYSIGAAYFSVPEAGSPLHSLLVKDLQVTDFCRERHGDDPVLWDNKLTSKFWEGAAEKPSHRQAYQRLHRFLRAISEDTAKNPFPHFPPETEKQQATLKKYDRLSLLALLEQEVGTLPDALFTAIEHYCWSSFGASSAEVSAAAGINFLAAEFESIYVPRGGNAAVAERILQRLSAVVPRGNLRSGSLVFDVRPNGEYVDVRYVSPNGSIRHLRARAVVMACPKFVVPKLIDNLEAARLGAIQSLQYRSYLVANVLCQGQPARDFYDLFIVPKEKTNRHDITAASAQHGATDVITTGYAQPHKEKMVLTLYRAFPHGGARAPLLRPQAFETLRAEVEKQVSEKLLPHIAQPGTKVVDIRLSRWGHPIPVAATGKLSDGTLALLQAPLNDQIFFVEQDNWLLPCLESAVGEALRQAPAIRKKVTLQT